MGEGGKDKAAEVGTSLAAQWLRLRTSKAGGVGLILVRELDPTC